MLREDTLKFQGARNRMISNLREMMKDTGLDNSAVLEAMFRVPRHYFFESAFDQKFAYENKAFQIGAGQTISQPFTVAMQTTLLNIKKRDKVLEIGTGSGYQTAVLLEMGARVYSIERQRLLHDNATVLLEKMGYRPRLVYGDGFKGLPAYGPFDSIIITCGAPFVPPALVAQLKIGGRLIIPVGEGDTQVMYKLTKLEDGNLAKEEWGNFSFVPMLEKVQRTKM